MDSQSVIIFIYNIEYAIWKFIQYLRTSDKEMSIDEFTENFIIQLDEHIDVQDYKKYLSIAKTKYYIDNYKNKDFDQDDFKFVHLNYMFNIYNANYEDFDNYSLIIDPDSPRIKYAKNLLRNYFLQFNEYQSDDSDELFNNLPNFVRQSPKTYLQTVN